LLWLHYKCSLSTGHVLQSNPFDTRPRTYKIHCNPQGEGFAADAKNARIAQRLPDLLVLRIQESLMDSHISERVAPERR
jgi:hypothetical protein